MAHKSLIGGTAYNVSGGKTLVGGTGYAVESGKTLVGGTGYDINFGSGLYVFKDGNLQVGTGKALLTPSISSIDPNAYAGISSDGYIWVKGSQMVTPAMTLLSYSGAYVIQGAIPSGVSNLHVEAYTTSISGMLSIGILQTATDEPIYSVPSDADFFYPYRSYSLSSSIGEYIYESIEYAADSYSNKWHIVIRSSSTSGEELRVTKLWFT